MRQLSPNSRLVRDNFCVTLRFTPVAPHPGRYAALMGDVRTTGTDPKR